MAKKPDRLPLPLLPEGLELPPLNRRKGESVAAAKARRIRQFRQDLIVSHLAHDASVREACAAVGIHWDTYYAWLAEDLEFAERCSAAETAPMRNVKKVNYLQSLKPDGVQDRKLLVARKSWGGNGKKADPEAAPSSAPASPGDAAKKIDELDDAAAAKLYHDLLKQKKGEA